MAVIEAQNIQQKKIVKNYENQLKLVSSGLKKLKESEAKLDKLITMLANQPNRPNDELIIPPRPQADFARFPPPSPQADFFAPPPNFDEENNFRSRRMDEIIALQDRFDDLEAKMCYMINELAYFRSRKYHSASMSEDARKEMIKMEKEHPSFKKDMHSHFNMTRNYQMYSMDRKVLNHNVVNRVDPFG